MKEKYENKESPFPDYTSYKIKADTSLGLAGVCVAFILAIFSTKKTDFTDIILNAFFASAIPFLTLYWQTINNWKKEDFPISLKPQKHALRYATVLLIAGYLLSLFGISLFLFRIHWTIGTVSILALAIAVYLSMESTKHMRYSKRFFEDHPSMINHLNIQQKTEEGEEDDNS